MNTITIDLSAPRPLANLSEVWMLDRKTQRLSEVLSGPAGEGLGCYRDYPEKLRWITDPKISLIVAALVASHMAGYPIENGAKTLPGAEAGVSLEIATSRVHLVIL